MVHSATYTKDLGMDSKPSFGIIVISIILAIVGLLNLVLGIMSIVSGAMPGDAARPIVTVGIGAILLGSIMLLAGVLWMASGIGLLIQRSWAYNMALYVSPAIVAINLAGVLNIWGFQINLGWAALSTVTGIASIWYLSRKELASFFIISVIEHIFIIMIFAVLIYSEPISVAEPSDAITVSIEEIKKEKKKEKKILIKKEPVVKKIKPKTPKKVEPEKLPTLPKMIIQSPNAANPGATVQSSVPQMPKTYAQITDKGNDAILRSPAVADQEKKYLDDLPNLDDNPAIYSSTKPTVGPAPSTTRTKQNSNARTGNVGVRNISQGTASSNVRVGPSSEVAKPGFVGDITGEIAGRKVIFWPKNLEEYKGTQGGSTTIKFWVDPPGSVIRTEVSKKSSRPDLDRIAREYVLQLRFAALPRNFEQKTQWGEIIIKFELTRKTE